MTASTPSCQCCAGPLSWKSKTTDFATGSQSIGYVARCTENLGQSKTCGSRPTEIFVQLVGRSGWSSSREPADWLLSGPGSSGEWAAGPAAGLLAVLAVLGDLNFG